MNSLNLKSIQGFFFFLWMTVSVLSLGASAGLIISKIKSQTLSPTELRELSEMLGISVGKSLDLNRLNQALRSSFSGGRFGDVRVFSDVRKRRQVIFIEAVRLKKLGTVDWSQVEPRFREETGVEKLLVSGQKVQVNELRSVTQKIRLALEENGYVDAKVDYQLVSTDDDEVMDLRLVVTKKERTEIKAMEFKGVSKELIAGFIPHLKVRAGSFFDKTLVDKSAQALTNFLITNQYPTAKVKWRTEKAEDQPNELTLIFELVLGMRYQFLFKGNEAIESSVLRSLIGMELLSQSDSSFKIKKSIEDRYRSLGYHFAKVDVDLGEEGREGAVIITIRISEGTKVFIDSIVFDGLWNERLGDSSAVFFENAVGVIRRRIFWEEGIEESTQRFLMYLREMGFLSASVTGPRVFFSEDRKGVQLFYDLQLGNLFQVKEIVFKGNQNISSEVLAGVLPFRAGDTLNRETLKNAAEAVKSKIQSAGFLDAKVLVEEKAGDVALSSRLEGVEIVFQVEEGPKYFVGKVKVEGLARTQEKVVWREILVHTGEPFDPEKLKQSEDNIALLGLFSRVEALTRASLDGPQIKDVVFVLSEIKPGFGEVGLGALYEDPLFRARTFLGLGYRNLFGLNQTASLRSEVSLPISRSNVLIPFVEYAALVNYRAPYLADSPFTLAVQGGFTSFQVAASADGKQSDLQTRARLEERLEKRISKRLTAQYRLHRLERTRTEVIEKQESGNTTTLSDTVDVIGSTGPTLMLDFRNDIFNPTSGSVHFLDAEFAHPNLLSNPELSFLLALQRNSFYFPISKTVNFSIYVGLGWARSLLSRGLPEARLANELALGGQGSIRGYAPRLFRASLGVRELAFYNVRSELTIPLFGEVSGAVFFDTGQLFPELKAESRNDGVGIGFRYKTPVGPIVLDLAHGLSPAAKSIVRFTFTVGSI